MGRARQTIDLDGKTYVVVPKDEFDELEMLARLPAYPEPDADGNLPAAAFMRVSIARGIVRDRFRLGLTQAELARRAGIPVETLSRIEFAHRDATVRTLDKIDAALKAAEPKAKSSPRTGTKRKRP